MTKRRYYTLGLFLIIILFFLYLFFKKDKYKDVVKLTNSIDSEIVLVNIGNGDRTYIGKLLLSIDSCNPLLIAIDAWFENEKDSSQDSELIAAFKAIKNDILSYSLDSNGRPLKSHIKFESLVSDEGLATVEKRHGLTSNIIPLQVIGKKVHENFALKIVKRWKPEFKHRIEINQSIPIVFTRTLRQFSYFEGSELREKNVCEFLKNKVVLLGFLGPGDEDKHFTPIRYVMEYKDGEPDTYGLVIIANAIRTILEHGH